VRWTLFESPGQLAEGAARHILERARAAIAARGAFHLVLAGGTTPRRTYELLGARGAGWQHWHLYFGDERCLPPDHPGRNSGMVRAALTERVPIPRVQVHPIPAELGPGAAAEQYRELLRGAPTFDLVLLGVGEDGHVASLFPGRPLAGEGSVIPVFDAPKPPPERVSLTLGALAQSREILYLVAGASKRAAVEGWRRGDPLPVSALPDRPEDRAFVDRAAWGAESGPQNPVRRPSE